MASITKEMINKLSKTIIEWALKDNKGIFDESQIDDNFHLNTEFISIGFNIRPIKLEKDEKWYPEGKANIEEIRKEIKLDKKDLFERVKEISWHGGFNVYLERSLGRLHDMRIEIHESFNHSDMVWIGVRFPLRGANTDWYVFKKEELPALKKIVKVKDSEEEFEVSQLFLDAYKALYPNSPFSIVDYDELIEDFHAGRYYEG